MNEIIKKINNIFNNENADINDVIYLLSLSEKDAGILFAEADRIRKKHVGGGIYLKGIIEFSSHCRCRCAYCGLNSENNSAGHYRMTDDMIIKYAKKAYDAGYSSLVLQSGEDLSYTKEMFGEIIRQIKNETGMIVTLSLGERSFDDYKYWRECGADRYLIKHETSNEKLYNEYHPHSDFKSRIRCQKNLYSLGYDLGSGFMVGLPGTCTADYTRDLMLIKSQKCQMAGIGPFIAHSNTALSDFPNGSLFMTRKCVAVLRILVPECNIPATTAYEVLGGNLIDLIRSGANVIMRKIEDSVYAKQYEIYPKETPDCINVQNVRDEIKKKLILNGFYINNKG